jgi:hypothetical protein
MISEGIETYYGVSCIHCNQPIAISAKAISLQGEIARKESNVPHTFVARCKLCEYEGVFAVSDIRIFDGEPRRRKPFARAAGA